MADVADPAAVERTRHEVERDLGVPHIVVQAEGWERPAADAAAGTAAVRAFLDGMIRRGRGGRVVVVATGPGAAGTAELAAELARYGILVNCVAPGPTDTPHFASRPGAVRRELERAIPLRRIAQPEEVAAAITFFASDAASFITGQVLSVSGGLTVHG